MSEHKCNIVDSFGALLFEIFMLMIQQQLKCKTLYVIVEKILGLYAGHVCLITIEFKKIGHRSIVA